MSAPHPGDDWLSRLRDRDLVDVLSALGCVQSGGRWSCPGCKEERERGGRRGPVGLGRGGQRWKCNLCGAGGGPVDAVALAVLGKVPTAGDRDGWRAVRTWTGDEAPALREAAPEAPPAYPPQEEVAACWRACTGLHQDGPQLHRRNVARAWLRVRGLDSRELAALDMVRVAEEADLPAWFPGWPWVLACPLVDCTGLTRSIRWRAVQGAKSPKLGGLDDLRALAAAGGELAEAARAALRDPAVVECMSPLAVPTLKSRAPGGFDARGLVLADPVARAVFAGRSEVEIGGKLWRWSGRLLLVEGEPALWSMATLGARWAADGSTFGVVGYSSGGWTAEHALRLSPGSTVRIIPDSDAAGQRMAEAVRRTIPPGVRVELAAIRR